MDFTMNNESAAKTPLNCTSKETNNYRRLEKIEEDKLNCKYPNNIHVPGGHSSFLEKRLQKKPKFFDSGDYQMAKQKFNSSKALFDTTGEAIPTPETVPVRKSYYTTEARDSSEKLSASFDSEPKLT
ncbi:cAMP-regulated phosphoprotein 19-like [Drosophila novamexicana]|uniref:cAMP-regulated phosphoprotein 19-like n=1 Tax=Drosophila novamexicana TaxID=47314 RepID=UPI0011E5BE6D|nr:cAMP-regulated phosphoprotein 19-like [Drosophila novamexicana]